MLSLRRQTARQRSILISVGCNSGMPFLRESPETCQYNFDLLARLERSRSMGLVKRLDSGAIGQSTHTGAKSARPILISHRRSRILPTGDCYGLGAGVGRGRMDG